jgi:hypothetical protein
MIDLREVSVGIVQPRYVFKLINGLDAKVVYVEQMKSMIEIAIYRDVGECLRRARAPSMLVQTSKRRIVESRESFVHSSAVAPDDIYQGNGQTKSVRCQ